MKVERVVIDTNVLISAALSASAAPFKVVQHFLANGLLIFSNDTFEEFETRVWRSKFDCYLTMEQRRSIVHDLKAVAEWVEPAQMPQIIAQRHSRDPDDDKFIWAALAGDAMLLISGDQDLLMLGSVSRLQILSPTDALTRIVRP